MDPNHDRYDDAETFRLEPPSTLWVGTKRYPAQIYLGGGEFTHPEMGEWSVYRRQARLYFENRWGLSIIWSTGSWSTNSYERIDVHGEPFVEEPKLVELGLLYNNALASEPVGWLRVLAVQLVIADVSQWSSEPNQVMPVRWRGLNEDLQRLLDTGP